MKLAFYHGDHSDLSLAAQIFGRIQKFGQKGSFGCMTHVEAIHEEFADGSVLIASSSFADGGVRSKRLNLSPKSWWIVDVANWDCDLSKKLLKETLGAQYDWRGAAATLLVGHEDSRKWFCNEWVGAPFLKNPHTFGPHQFAAVALSLGRDVTESFFKERQNG